MIIGFQTYILAVFLVDGGEGGRCRREVDRVGTQIRKDRDWGLGALTEKLSLVLPYVALARCGEARGVAEARLG